MLATFSIVFQLRVVAGTPMAVLVDAEGKIASELAAGAPAVLELAGQQQADVPKIPAPPRQSWNK